MSYPEGVMGSFSQETSEPKKEIISWEVVSPQRLRELIDDTISEEVLQNMVAIKMGLEMLGNQDIKSQQQTQRTLDNLTSQVNNQLRSLQKILRHDLTKPLPIDHRYESGGGKSIIALDIVATSAPFK